MKMQALVARQNLTYAGKNVKAGGTFMASPRDAKLLVLVKRAQIDPAVDPLKVRQEVPVVEIPPVDVVTEAVRMPKRSYTRRSSRTED